MTSGWRIALWVAVVFAALGFLYLVRGILFPFIVAFIVAALLDPLVQRLRLRGWSRKYAVVSVVFPIYAVGFVVLALVVPRATNDIMNATTVVNSFATSITKASEYDNYFLRWNPAIQAKEAAGPDGTIDKLLQKIQGPLGTLGLPTSRRELVETYIAPQRSRIAKTVQDGVASFFGFLTGFAGNLLGIIVLILVPPLLLMDLEDMQRRFPKYIPPAIRASTLALISDIGGVFVKYLRGVVSVMLLYALCAAIMLTVLNVHYSLLLAILFAALYMIPYIGNIIVYAIIFLTVGLTGTDGTFFLHHMASPWAYAAVATVIYAAMGLIFDQLLYPALVGNAVGLNTVTSIFVVFCGGALFGLVGMVIAFPLAGAIKIIFDRVMRLTSVTQDSAGLPAVPLRHRRTAAA
ncbi:MAG: AI-2E family transporter [Fimbriimonadaceae bacterium]